MKTAIIVLGHGSRHQESEEPFAILSAAVKAASGFEIVEHAFLQYSGPTIDAAVGSCLKQGSVKIIIVPFFLQSGAHVTKDIPDLLAKLRQRYPDILFTVTDYVGAHPVMATIVADLAKKC